MFAGSGLTCVRGERLVFRALDFVVAPGEALVVQGPNGAGKSSLLRLAAGLLRPAAGSLTWNRAPVDADPDAHRARLAYVGHLDAVKPALTARENLAFWSRLAGGGADIGPALAAMGLGALAEVRAQFLSAGEKRRLNLARLAACPAPLWLLDEPTVSLDQAGVARFTELARAHLANGGLIMAATHLPLDLPGGALALSAGARAA
jgi:heme exporter protein A